MGWAPVSNLCSPRRLDYLHNQAIYNPDATASGKPPYPCEADGGKEAEDRCNEHGWQHSRRARAPQQRLASHLQDVELP